jgi:hypothetical protein
MPPPHPLACCSSPAWLTPCVDMASELDPIEDNAACWRVVGAMAHSGARGTFCSRKECTRRQPVRATKSADEVTLVGEADVDGNLRGRLAASQQRTSARQAQVGLVLMRRQTEAAAKHAQELELTEARGVGQLLQRDLLSIASMQHVPSTLDRGDLVARHGLGDAAIHALGKHTLDCAREQLLAL